VAQTSSVQHLCAHSTQIGTGEPGLLNFPDMQLVAQDRDMSCWYASGQPRHGFRAEGLWAADAPATAMVRLAAGATNLLCDGEYLTKSPTAPKPWRG